jgi:hypothetical protein
MAAFTTMLEPIYFHSKDPVLNRVEYWGTFTNYRASF